MIMGKNKIWSVVIAREGSAEDGEIFNSREVKIHRYSLEYLNILGA